MYNPNSYKFRIVLPSNKTFVEVLLWAKEQFGSPYIERWSYAGIVFYFKHESDAAFFKLTWL